MAQDNLKKLSKDLSFKIFDPVNAGEDDGKVFLREHRLGYISRAYGQLVRVLEIIHPSITKVFKNYHKLIEAGDLTIAENGTTITAGTGSVYQLDKPWHIIDVYYAETSGGTKKRADYISPENYMPARIGINKHYVPSTEDRFWTLMDNAIKLLPVDGGYYDVTLFVRNYFPAFAFGTDVDVDIPEDYMDILITMAAIEAMSDKGDGTKYKLYTDTLTGQLNLISASKQREDLNEEAKK